MVKANMRTRKAPKPLSATSLEELALYYAGRFAVTPAKLEAYLRRKLRERGVAEGFVPNLDQLIEKLAELGAVSDQAVAEMVISSQQRRGFGAARTRQQLRYRQVASAVAEESLLERAVNPEILAVKFAMRKRLGPFRVKDVLDPRRLEKEISAMVRAGHAPGLAARIVRAATPEKLADDLGLEQGLEGLP